MNNKILYDCDCPGWKIQNGFMFDTQDLRESNATKCPCCDRPFKVIDPTPPQEKGEEVKMKTPEQWADELVPGHNELILIKQIQQDAIVSVQKELLDAKALVASYDRQDELIGTEFEGVDEVTDIIRLLKKERDTLRASCQKKDEALRRFIVEATAAIAFMEGVKTNIPELLFSSSNLLKRAIEIGEKALAAGKEGGK